MNRDEEALKALIALLGGDWGALELENRYADLEKCIYSLHQIGDESNDSWVARSTVAWSKMLAKGITLEEVQGFVLLRHSTIIGDDKKKSW